MTIMPFGELMLLKKYTDEVFRIFRFKGIHHGSVPFQTDHTNEDVIQNYTAC